MGHSVKQDRRKLDSRCEKGICVRYDNSPACPDNRKVQTGEVCGQRHTQTDMPLEDDDDFEVQNGASRTRQSTDVSQGHTEGQAPVTT